MKKRVLSLKFNWKIFIFIFLEISILLIFLEIVGANDLTPHNNVSYISSLTTDGAAHFTAYNISWLDMPSNPTVQGGETDLTFAAWVKLDAVGALPMVIISKDDDLTSDGSEYYLGYYPGYGSWVFQVETEPGPTRWKISSAGVPSADIWYFVIGWYDHLAGTVNIQINNGTIDTLTGAENSTHVTDTLFSVGSDYNTNTNLGASLMNGTIDSLGFWKRVLTTDEKSILWGEEREVIGTNLGTLHTGMSYSADVPSVLSENIYSVSFNGTPSYISFANSVQLSPNSSGSAVSLWFNADNLSGKAILGNSIDPDAYILLKNATTIQVQTDNFSTVKYFTVPTMSTGTWYNLIVNRDITNNTRVYLDGTESSSGGQSQPIYPITINQMGRYWDNSYPEYAYTGKLSELKLFDSSLTASDISALSSGDASTTVPVLYWKLNESSGTQVIDYGTTISGTPLKYSELPDEMLTESKSTFISWWDLGETSGTRYDSRSIAPTVQIISPTTTTYTTSSVSFEVRTNENSTCNYSVDSGATNYSMTANSTDTGFTASKTLSNGDYAVNYYCFDILDNLNNTESVSFSVDVLSTTTSSGTSLAIFKPTQKQLENGYEGIFTKKQKIQVNSSDQEQNIFEIKEINETGKNILVSLGGNNYSIIENSSDKINLNDDEYYDLEISVIKVYSTGYAKMEFKEIHEEIPAEDKEPIIENVTENVADNNEEIASSKDKIIYYILGGIIALGIILYFVLFRRN